MIDATASYLDQILDFYNISLGDKFRMECNFNSVNHYDVPLTTTRYRSVNRFHAETNENTHDLWK